MRSPDFSKGSMNRFMRLGIHSHQNCPATHGNVYRDNISEYVSQAAAANYNQVSSNFRPQMVANHIRPPGFPPVQNSQANNANNFNRGNNFNQNRESNFNQNRGGWGCGCSVVGVVGVVVLLGLWL
ncbi:hypothetical protein Tco_1120170 [Tanacetum coccineum]